MSDPQKYDELLKKYTNLKDELETMRQNLYDYKRQISVSKTLEAEYQEEIRILQSQGTEEKEKLEAKVLQLEEANANLKCSYKEQIIDLEKELQLKDEKIAELEKSINSSVKQEVQGDDDLVKEFVELQEQHSELTERIGELEQSLEVNEKHNAVLQQTVKKMEEELETFKEALTSKRQEIEEAKILIQNLQDDNSCLKSELDKTRSKPLDDQSKGNSLFAEVDDRRLQLQQYNNIMKTQYLEMKRERAAYLKQITTLRNENTALIKQREADIDGKLEDEEMISQTYKTQIKTLNDLIESYQKELQDNSKINASLSKDVKLLDQMKFFHNMLAGKNEEIERLRQELTTHSLNYTSLAYDLAEANRKIRKYSLEILQLENEIGKLKVKIEEIQMKSPTAVTPPEEVITQKSILKLPKTEVETNDDENKGVDKKVQIDEGPSDSFINDRRRARRGAKVLASKPVKYY